MKRRAAGSKLGPSRRGIPPPNLPQGGGGREQRREQTWMKRVLGCVCAMCGQKRDKGQEFENPV